jgi:hypothetical protein
MWIRVLLPSSRSLRRPARSDEALGWVVCWLVISMTARRSRGVGGDCEVAEEEEDEVIRIVETAVWESRGEGIEVEVSRVSRHSAAQHSSFSTAAQGDLFWRLRRRQLEVPGINPLCLYTYNWI